MVASRGNGEGLTAAASTAVWVGMLCWYMYGSTTIERPPDRLLAQGRFQVCSTVLVFSTRSALVTSLHGLP